MAGESDANGAAAPSTTTSSGVSAQQDGEISATAVSSSAQAAVFVKSAPVPSHFARVCGPNFDQRQSLQSLLEGYGSIGFQASAIAEACSLVDKMVSLPPSSWWPIVTSC